MIFVTVGTHSVGFERLIQKMDEIAVKINQEVIMQIGCTNYVPENTEWFKFADIAEIMDLYKNADIIVTHAGAGSLLDALSFEKPIITVPRLKKFGEHIDDQQIELAEVLDSTNKAVAVYDIEKLEDMLTELDMGISKDLESEKGLTNFLKGYLNS